MYIVYAKKTLQFKIKNAHSTCYLIQFRPTPFYMTIL
jgi:hypothetical protein